MFFDIASIIGYLRAFIVLIRVKVVDDDDGGGDESANKLQRKMNGVKRLGYFKTCLCID